MPGTATGEETNRSVLLYFAFGFSPPQRHTSWPSDNWWATM